MAEDKSSNKGFFASFRNFLPFQNITPTTPIKMDKTSAISEFSNTQEKISGYHDHPVEREELGRNTWSLLHSMAAYLPEKLSPDEGKEIKNFMTTLGKFYPCDVCADELSNSLKKNPPDTSSRNSFCQWMCRLHNGVNERLDKPIFDCSKVEERWKDGWMDQNED